MSTRILIVDDHEIVRSGLRRLVERQSGWEVCGEAVNGKEAIDKALALNPDLVLMDISMPVMNGIEATRQIRRLSPVTKIVIVSLRDDESITAEAKNAGAVIEHEATTSKVSEEQLFYCLQRGLSAEEATALIVNGFVRDVLQQLPMEFAVEAQKLISISLEGSVG